LHSILFYDDVSTLIEAPELKLCVCLYLIRWHKWGHWIGNHIDWTKGWRPIQQGSPKSVMNQIKSIKIT